MTKLTRTGLEPDPDTILDWVEDEYVISGKLTLRYRRVGKDSSPVPLVLVNGIGAPLEMWAPFVQEFTTRDLIVFDLPGCGRSTTPTFLSSIAWFADVVRDLLDELGLEQVDMLGFSFGGAVTQEFALRHPTRLRRLALVSTTPGIPALPGNPMALAVAATPLRYLNKRIGEFMIPRLAGGQMLRDHDLMMHELWRRQLEPPTIWGYTVQLCAIAVWSSCLWLHTLKVPTLVVHGGEDPLCPAVNAKWIAERVPDSEYLLLPRSGHLLLIDEPHLAVGPLKSFLDAEAPKI